MYVMGDNSIFKLAQDAKDKTEQAKNDERDYFNNLDNTINQYIDGNSGESNPSSKVDVSTITDKVDKNTPAEDSLGNPITIPEGFKVVPDGQDGVEYTYTGDKKPTVQDGIVIADDENNQFVWIPVGSIKNKDNTTTTIQLARYTFNTGSSEDGSVKETKTDGSLLKTSSSSSYGYLEEDATSTTYGNTKAKNIEEFKIKAKANGGYYLARFEASKGIDNKVKSKSAAVWNNITQPEVATKAREMYTSTNFESDLVNSYAWDTAIVFIQTYSGDNDYSKQNSKNTSLANTGVNNDKVCNIYDMASNTAEWTTETSTVAGYPCTYRGGNYGNSNFYTAGRDSNVTSGSSGRISFRPLLYAK